LLLRDRNVCPFLEHRNTGFLGGHADKLTDAGHRRLVRHGRLPEREIMTGIGPVRDQLG
jgi:putative transposase